MPITRFTVMIGMWITAGAFAQTASAEPAQSRPPIKTPPSQGPQTSASGLALQGPSPATSLPGGAGVNLPVTLRIEQVPELTVKTSGSGTQSAVALRIDQVPELTVKTVGAPSDWSVKDWLSLISAVTALAAVGLGYWSNRRTLDQAEKNAQRATIQKENEKELEALQMRLEEFYGPFMVLAKTNWLLAKELASRQKNPREFRVLPVLLSPERRKALTLEDMALIKEIVAINEQLGSLIQQKVGLVSEEVQEYLGRAAAHYRIIRLAFAGPLNDPGGDFSKIYVYPRQLDEVLRLEVGRLQRRCDLLRHQLAEKHPPIEPLSITRELKLEPWPDPRKEASQAVVSSTPST